tara:strand:+ start:87 stop:506 length:420 start_codon:yes stop_codon:yes gene_type:complete
VKKKTLISKKDKKIWEDYLKNPNDIFDKENKIKNKTYSRSRYRFDLHGLSLDAANKKVEEIIMFCSKNNYSELLLITGKGLHSNSEQDVFSSRDFSKLRYSVPDYIKSSANLNKIVKSIVPAAKEDGGEGALLINLKNL